MLVQYSDLEDLSHDFQNANRTNIGGKIVEARIIHDNLDTVPSKAIL